MCLQFQFVIFGRKDFGAKAAHKMLVKLTPGVNKKGPLLRADKLGLSIQQAGALLPRQQPL